MKFNLIQRASFKNPQPARNVGIDSILSMDYMGAAEFEFGSLPASLKELCKNFPTLHETEIRHPQTNYKLQIVTANNLSEIKGFINSQMIGDHKHRLKEPAYFPYFNRGKASCEIINEIHGKIDCWWDIANHWFACFGKTNGQRIMTALEQVKIKKGW